MINNPELWNELLTKFDRNYAILMDGSVRDWYCNKLAKDFDIFYPYSFGQPVVEGWTYIALSDNHQEDYEVSLEGSLSSPIGAVYNYDAPFQNEVYRVQLVGVHYANPIEHFSNFDHTLTLGAYTLNQGIFIDNRLVKSVRDKIVTCLNTSNVNKALLRAKRAVSRISPNEEDMWTYQNFQS